MIVQDRRFDKNLYQKQYRVKLVFLPIVGRELLESVRPLRGVAIPKSRQCGHAT